MYLRAAGALVLALWVVPSGAQDSWLAVGEIDVDILFNYYTQDGEHSPVTGGVGTEEMDVISPVVLVAWRVDEDWTLRSDLGVDGISSASVDAIDDDVSSASREDERAYLTVTGSRQLGASTLRLTAGLSTEYDYSSLIAGVGWTRSWNRQNTTLDVGLRHYSDTVDLYDIDGENRGEDDRTTTDFTLGLTQVLGLRTLFSAELYLSDQSGFLSTPFHEVILTDGRHVAERLPDARRRTALGLWLNQALSQRSVVRLHYRFYDDDWGIEAHTAAIETHFQVRAKPESWIYPILRYYTQTASDQFGLPQAFTGDEPFYTADRDLSGFDSVKYGLGWRMGFKPAGKKMWLRRARSFETRLTRYEREDGLESVSASLAWGWRMR